MEECKEYYENGQLKFEGMYCCRKKFWHWKIYYQNGMISFEGDYAYNKKNEIVKEYDI